jgi:hypothetical protein
MWNPAGPTRRALALAMAAAVAFLGSATMARAGSAILQLAGGQAPNAQPGVFLLAIVILFAATGVLLLALAGKEFLDERRRSHAG